MKPRFLLLFLLCLPTWLGAEIYKGTDANGNTIYSDQPFANSKPVNLPPLPTYSSPAIKIDEQSPGMAPENQRYQIRILQPQSEQTFTTDIRTIDIQLQVTPGLQENDGVQILINGQPYGTPAKTLYFQVQDLPRGSYQLQAEIKNEGKTVAKSEAITFFQQRAIAKNAVHSNSAPQAPRAP